MKASDMPLGFYMHRPDTTTTRDYYYFRDHIKMMDGLLVSRREEIEAQEIPKEPFADVDRNDKLGALQNFGRIVRQNNFLAAVSMLETQFKNLIEYFEREKPIAERFQLVDGKSMLQQCFSHIHYKMGVDIGKQNQTLNDLKEYYVFRNAIIHYIGYLELPKYNDTFGFLKKFSNVEVVEEKGLNTKFRTTILDNSFTIDFCNKAEEFIVKIFNLISIDPRFSHLI